MPVILVVEQDATYAEQITTALQSEGWTVRICERCDDALRQAAMQPPELVIASSALPGVRDFLAGFSRQRGGPGAVALIPITLLNRVSAADYQADAITPKPISVRDLRLLVESFLATPSAAAAGAASPQPRSPRLSSAEIFGEVLAEVEGEAPRAKRSRAESAPRRSDDIERKLEETLSGVLPVGDKLKRPASTERPKRRATPAPTDTDEIDKLLDKTLSTLELPARSKKPSRPQAPPQAAPPAAAEPAATMAPPAAEAAAPPTSEAEASPAVADELAAWPGFEPPPELEPPPIRLELEPTDTPPEAAQEPPPGEVLPEVPDFEEPLIEAGPLLEETGPLAEEPGPEEPFPELTEPMPEAGPLFEEPPAEQPRPEAEMLAEEPEFEAELLPDEPPFEAGSLLEESALEEPALEAGSLLVEPLSELPGPQARSGVEPSAPLEPSPEIPSRFDTLDFRTRELPIIRPGDFEGQPFGDYTLLDRIAVGGMAEVWKARRRGVEGFQKTVAIKKILSHLTGNPDFVTMFIDEAKLAAQLNHNNIIQIYDLGKVESDFFIAMEYVDGRDLRTILATGKRQAKALPMGLALMIAACLARALDYAHRKRDFDNRALGLVHRDVSPQNVLISYEGEIKLCDFGIVKAVVKASTTQMGALKGKLQYMSPEQAWGKTVDARSDIFSLGSVFFEMLTGTKLFSGDSEIGVLDAVRACRVRSPREIVPEISPQVDRIVRRALSGTPEDRYQTAGEMEQDLKTVLFELEPRPSQSDLAKYMHQLFEAPAPEEVEAPPQRVEVEGAAPAVGEGAVSIPADEPSIPADAPSVPADAVAAAGPEVAVASRAAAGSKRRRVLLAAVVAAVVVAVIIGAFLVWPLLSPLLSSRDTAPRAQTPPPEAVTTPAAAEPVSAEAPGQAADVAAAGEVGPEPGEAPGAEEGAIRHPTELTADEIQELVNQRLGQVAEEMTQEFETERQRLERELAAARRAAEALEAEEESGDESGGENEGGEG